MSMYGDGKFISKDRFEISDGLKVYFYESASIQNEFANFGLIKFADMEEPIKFEKGHDPMKLILVICKKSENY